jgi:hypothetical protein
MDHHRRGGRRGRRRGRRKGSRKGRRGVAHASGTTPLCHSPSRWREAVCERVR